jgi:magnesium chelatase subunit D
METGFAGSRQNDSQLRLVVIPDLTKLSLAAARACVVLMGADVAHLERHGQQANWQPNLCWLAGCASGEVGVVSPHLLDRFALRLSGRVTKTTDRAAEILEWMDDRALEKETKPEPLPIEIRDRLQKAILLRPAITVQATARILDYTSTLEVYSPRREIALGRLALANAQLEGAAEMTAAHVDAAARMIGLKPVAKQTEDSSNVSSEPVTPQPDLPKPTEATPTSTPSLTHQPESSTVRSLCMSRINLSHCQPRN